MQPELTFKLPHASPIYMGPSFVCTSPADALAPNGARPSAGTVMTSKLHMFSTKFLWLPQISIYFAQMTSFKMADYFMK